MKAYKSTLFLILLAGHLFSCVANDNYGKPVVQTAVPRVELMPNAPAPYKILNWKQKAKDYDAYVFDFNPDMPAGKMIWLDNIRRTCLRSLLDYIQPSMMYGKVQPITTESFMKA